MHRDPGSAALELERSHAETAGRRRKESRRANSMRTRPDAASGQHLRLHRTLWTQRLRSAAPAGSKSPGIGSQEGAVGAASRHALPRCSQLLERPSSQRLGGGAILSGGGKGESEEREPTYLNSASRGPFDDRAATDRSPGSDSSSDADASGWEAARFFGRAFASDLRRRLDCSDSGLAGFSTAATRGTLAGSDTTVELDATAAACGVAAAECDVAAAACGVAAAECGVAAAACGVAAAECGVAAAACAVAAAECYVAAGCVTTTG